MSERGYIKLWRQVRQSEIWKHDGCFQLWCDLLMRVTHKRRKTILNVGGKPIRVDLAEGQCAIRPRLLADDLGIAYNTARSRLALLQEYGYIDQQPRARYTLVTVPNWLKYQAGQRPIGSKIEPVLEPVLEPVTEPHNKKTQKIKKVREASARFVKPTVEEVREYSQSIGYSLEAQRFIDHYESVGWRVGRNPMRDWRAAVRTWRSRDASGGNGKPKSQTLEDLYPDLTNRGPRR